MCVPSARSTCVSWARPSRCTNTWNRCTTTTVRWSAKTKWATSPSRMLTSSSTSCYARSASATFSCPASRNGTCSRRPSRWSRASAPSKTTWMTWSPRKRIWRKTRRRLRPHRPRRLANHCQNGGVDAVGAVPGNDRDGNRGRDRRRRKKRRRKRGRVDGIRVPVRRRVITENEVAVGRGRRVNNIDIAAPGRGLRAHADTRDNDFMNSFLCSYFTTHINNIEIMLLWFYFWINFDINYVHSYIHACSFIPLLISIKRGVIRELWFYSLDLV